MNGAGCCRTNLDSRGFRPLPIDWRDCEERNHLQVYIQWHGRPTVDGILTNYTLDLAAGLTQVLATSQGLPHAVPS